jgi:DNA-directed RNA polymerase specialized sigma24 family protein
VILARPWPSFLLAMPSPDPASSAAELLLLDAALDKLASLHPRQAMLVESRFFGGFEVSEISVILDVSEATLLRDWRAAKAWLANELSVSRTPKGAA